DVSVSLLAVVVTLCGVALLGVSLFVSWKLCWVPCRDREREARAAAAGAARSAPYLPQQTEPELQAPAEAMVRMSHTSPDIHASGRDSNPVRTSQTRHGERQARHARFGPCCLNPPPPPEQNPTMRSRLPALPAVRAPSARCSTDPPGAARKKLLRTNTLGRIKPELYKARPSVPAVGDMKAPPCGRINFQVRYDYEGEQLVVKINKAVDLPAKDFSGTSDPYVKIYLLPERKRKYQTKVHRKTLNPVFDETFQFGVPYSELASRRLHFSVYDFDRFSRHDIIGTVLVDNLLEATDHSRETSIWRDIEFSSTVRA
uniref:Synaptotagmin 6 n=1 Tax=Petromyzon marinus TaxID=7757 RepID=S4RYU1_PETMA